VRLRDGRVVADRRSDDEALVVGRSGWLQLPSELIGPAGISSRAHVRAVPGGLLLTQAPPPPPPDAVCAPARPGPAGERHRAAQVELCSISRSYARRRVLAEISERFEPGAMTVLQGPSGTGKTTLLRLVAGLDRPDSGRVTVDDLVLGEHDDERLAELRRHRIGYLPQAPAPVGFLSATENVMLALRIRGWEAAAAAGRAAATLARVGLADRAAQRVHRLSAGEAQRVALARALASARGLLLVDEPTSRLDETSAGMVADLLADAAAEEGQTVICATHDPAVIRRAAHVVSLHR
jgi:ABC-type lipoprotein export system ATPase subunit